MKAARFHAQRSAWMYFPRYSRHRRNPRTIEEKEELFNQRYNEKRSAEVVSAEALLDIYPEFDHIWDLI
jgi:hypothetical protein